MHLLCSRERIDSWYIGKQYRENHYNEMSKNQESFIEIETGIRKMKGDGNFR